MEEIMELDQVVLVEETAEEGSSEDLYEQTLVTYERGQVVKGKVVKVEPEGVFVDIGGKTEGLIPAEETGFHLSGSQGVPLQVGQEVNVYILKVGDEEGTLLLSKRRADLEQGWRRIREAWEKGEVLTATVVEKVKGGVLVDLGPRGFVPASHLSRRPVRNLDDYVGEELTLKVIELDLAKSKVVLSHKVVVEQEEKVSKEALWGDVYEGQIREGVVARLAPFGAFIDLGGVDGLVHLSELSWKRVSNPQEVLRVGQKLQVMVIKIDREKEKISLSLRRALPDPWLTLEQEFKPGQVVPATVTKIAKKYVFVEVAPGIEALIPLVELADQKLVNPSEVLSVSQNVQVKVLEVNPQARRMIVSLRQAQSIKEMEELKEYIQGQDQTPLTIGDLLGSRGKGNG